MANNNYEEEDSIGFGGRGSSPQDAYNQAYARIKAASDFQRKGRRIDGRAPMAKPQSGLWGGGDKTTRMSNSDWVNTFTNTGTRTQAAALNERRNQAGTTFDPGNRKNYNGISAGVVDEVMKDAMGSGFWNRTFGGGKMTPATPFNATRIPARPTSQTPRYASAFGWNAGI